MDSMSKSHDESGDSQSRRKHRDVFGFVTRFPTLAASLPLYSWAWFLMPMTTLGLSTLLNAQLDLHNFQGLYTIGLIVYFVGVVQFAFVVLAKVTKFLVIRGSFRKSLTSPEEALFSAAFWIACYGVIIGGIDFASPKPGTALSYMFLSLFWIYMVCAILGSGALHLLMFHGRSLEGKNMTPAWLLPILPVILIGVMAGALQDKVHPHDAYPTLLAGAMCSSTGFLLSISVNALYLHRLFCDGLPVPDVRPAMMIAVGPPTYAPLAFLKLATSYPSNFDGADGYFMASHIAQEVAKLVAIAIWGLGVFFFLMALASIVRRAKHMSFHLTWYGFIFPNVGLLSTLGLIGTVLYSDGISWVAAVGTVLLTGVWLFVTASHIWAIARRSQYLW